MMIAGYWIHIDALLARIVYRWHWQVGLGAVIVGLLIGLLSGLIPPFWRGAVTLAIVAPNDTQVQVDGQNWPYSLYAGTHRIVARDQDGREAWTDIDMTAGLVMTVTLPSALHEPRVRTIPPAGPGTQIGHVWWADYAWRVQSIPRAIPADQDPEKPEPTQTPGAGQTIAVSAAGVERLTTLDAYAGLADQVHVDGRLVEVVYQAESDDGYGKRELGMLEVRGWGAYAQQITVTAPLSLVQLAPTGDMLLLAEQVASGGEQVSVVRAGMMREPVIALPGKLTRLNWRDDGNALILHSRQGDRLTLTLVRLVPSVAAVVIAELPVDRYADDLVPLTWDADGLWWVAPDQDGVSTLWSASLAALIPEWAGVLDVCALNSLPDGALQIVFEQDGVLAIGTYQDGLLIGQTIVPHISVTPDLAGMWHGQELLLQSGENAWLLDLSQHEQGNRSQYDVPAAHAV